MPTQEQTTHLPTIEPVPTTPTILCFNCDTPYPEDEITYASSGWPLHDDNPYCEDCFSELFAECSNCHDITLLDDTRVPEYDGRCCCEECYNNLYTTCYECNCELLQSNCYTINGYHYCDSCFSDNFITCYDCGDTIPYDESLSPDWNNSDNRYCESCYNNLEPPNRPIHSHDYIPYLNFQHTEQEGKYAITHTNDLPYLGIELETERAGSYITRDTMANTIHNMMPQFLYVKSDGSLSHGIEIVSHPATFNWLTQPTTHKQINKVLHYLQDKGYRSYNTDSCGIHIHVSRQAFTTLHLYKFLKLFYENESFILRISQRIQSNLQSWAAIKDNDSYYRTDADSRDGRATPTSITYKAKRKVGGPRYTAVNLSNPQTIEVRIFRGNLNTNAYWKNVQFVQAAYEYTQTESITRINPTTFTQFVRNNWKRFNDLNTFLKYGHVSRLYK